VEFYVHIFSVCLCSPTLRCACIGLMSFRPFRAEPGGCYCRQSAGVHTACLISCRPYGAMASAAIDTGNSPIS
jgi:hypothetical protein